jgi:Pentapeptide repeats (8 copies)
MTITKEQLDLHVLWRQEGPGGVRLVAIDADLRNADLRNADLRNADLSDADLSDADLSYADLRYANFAGAIGLAPITEGAIDIVLEIADIVLADRSKLGMSEVHECETTHCGAGWFAH